MPTMGMTIGLFGRPKWMIARARMNLQGSDTPSADEGADGTTCSICLEVVDVATKTQSMAKLRCGHEFHLGWWNPILDYYFSLRFIFAVNSCRIPHLLWYLG